MIYLIALAAFAATYLGGLFALKLKDRLHLVLGFSAGALLGVAFFDLLPEALSLGSSVSTTMMLVALGFAIYLLLDRAIVLHMHHEDDHAHAHRGSIGAGTLALHSFLDGLAIGIAFHVSSAVGLVVTAAVLVHDFSDGINTVNMVLKGGGARSQALKWLFIDAVAPVVGIFAASWISLSSSQLALLLALFAGFFLYIGASDLLPESHHAHPVWWTTFATLLGMMVLYGAVAFAGI